MDEKERNTYPKWIHCGLIERQASKHKKDVAREITDENELFSLREVGNALNETADIFSELIQEKDELKKENDGLKQEKKKIFNIINNKITKLGMYWYGTKDNSKEEKEATLQLKVLIDLKEEIIKELKE